MSTGKQATTLRRAAFQIVLKRRPHRLLIASMSVKTCVSSCRLSLPDHQTCSSEYASEALEDVYTM
ncbi:MAG: hypothetical protein JSV40_08295, partial [Deltaproteobacteria bacterium]